MLRQRSRNRWAVAFRGLVALLFGLVVFMTPGAPVQLYVADVLADVILAAMTAVAPPP